MKIKKMSVNILVPWILSGRVFRIPPQVFAGWSLFFTLAVVLEGSSFSRVEFINSPVFGGRNVGHFQHPTICVSES